MTEQRSLELPTLGRPMQLGMLYDCRSDVLIPGITLWDPATLQSDRSVSSQPSTQFNIISSDGIDDKASALNVEASLKASFMSGLVEVQGSAKYLNDRKSSEHQSRLTLQYKTTTRFEQLTMKHLGSHNVQHPDVFDQGTATHVVTGILYGAQAFFVFDRDCANEENIKDVQGKLHVMVKKIPSLEIEGDGSLKLSEHEKVDQTSIRCTFHGDFTLETNPSNYEEAVDIYRQLPTMLGDNGENAVPIRVWLYPLAKLDDRSAKLIRQISVNLISQSLGILEGLDQLQVKCNDNMMQGICNDFPQFLEKLGLLKKMLLEQKLSFQQYLAGALPAIRGGSVEEHTLAEVILQSEQSPFSLKQVGDWITSKEKEMSVVKAYMKIFNGIQIIRSRAELDALILDPLMEYIVCFSFPIIGHEEEYIEVMSRYLKSHNSSSYRPGKGWFDDVSASKNIRKYARSFVEFYKANKENAEIKFAVTGFDDGETKTLEGGSIFLYEHGVLTTKLFEPPSIPGKLSVVKKSHDEISIEWLPPTCGQSEVQHYQVKYKETEGVQLCSSDWMEEHTTADERQLTIGGLKPFTSYEMIVIAVCRAGASKGSERIACVTLPASFPTQLKKYRISESTISIVWKKPSVIGEGLTIDRYIVKYKQVSGSTKIKSETEATTSDPSCSFTVEDLQVDTQYIFRVSAVCGDLGTGTESESIEIITESNHKVKKYAQEIASKARILTKGCKAKGEPKILQLPLIEVPVHSRATYRSFSFGKRSGRCSHHKVIMVVGATGAGKSTLINGMINYILGVDWKDGYRFKIVNDHGEGLSNSQAHSQTQIITSYTIYKNKHHNIPYTLTIIDTPGFGDTRGIQRDKAIIDQIQDFFSHSDTHQVDHIDGIGFVAQSSQARLTHTQRYVFDSILSVFGKDISPNILLLVTFADGQKPPVINAVREANIPCSDSIFKFNNSALFASNKTTSAGSAVGGGTDDEDEDTNFDKMFWRMGVHSMSNFFISLNQLEPRSLSLTKEVLEERKRLEVSVEGLQPQIQMGVCKFEELRREHQILEQHEVDIEANKDFSYEVEVPKSRQINISGSGNFITNCSKCHFTCHFPCGIANDKEKEGCWAMTSGSCRVCPGKCIWNVHFNQKYKFEYYSEKEMRTYAELEERYRDAAGKKLTVEQVIHKHEQEFLNVQKCVFVLITDSHQSLKRLEEIALKPNPLSTVEYVDLLIESEKIEAKPGWQSRVKALQDIRKQADIMGKVKQANFDPFENYKIDFERSKKNKKGKQWYMFWKS